MQPGLAGPQLLTDADAAAAGAFHQSLACYRPTALAALPALARRLGVRGIYVKDESTRFGLKAFKGLGGTYAMFRILCDRLGLDPARTDFRDFQKPELRAKTAGVTFVTATDGNHGKGVAWAAGLFGCKAYVFMPAGSAAARAQAIRAAGSAQVETTDRSYDETVDYARRLSRKNGWVLIQDTAWDGYETIPLWIIQGYLTMAAEAADELDRRGLCPTHVFLQAGVGAMAGCVCGYLMNHYAGRRPVVSIVEPDAADCIYRSALAGDGAAHAVGGAPQTIMAGLNCGTPCKITWPILRDFASAYFSCPDYVSACGMRTYARPCGSDPAIISGESGAVTLGLLRLLLERDELAAVRSRLRLGPDSVVLLFSTEGDTDPENYRRIVEQGAYPVPD